MLKRASGIILMEIVSLFVIQKIWFKAEHNECSRGICWLISNYEFSAKANFELFLYKNNTNIKVRWDIKFEAKKVDG